MMSEVNASSSGWPWRPGMGAWLSDAGQLHRRHCRIAVLCRGVA